MVLAPPFPLFYFPVTHYMKLASGPFDRMEAGVKKLEIRLHDEKRSLVQVGEPIEFSRLPDLERKIVRVVEEVMLFSSFDVCFSNIDVSLLGYDLTVSRTDLARGMYTYYAVEEEKAYGVVAFLFQ